MVRVCWIGTACASLTEPGDKVLVISNGIFGEGFKGLVETYGGEVTLFETDVKNTLDIDKLRIFLEKIKILNMPLWFIVILFLGYLIIC